MQLESLIDDAETTPELETLIKELREFGQHKIWRALTGDLQGLMNEELREVAMQVPQNVGTFLERERALAEINQGYAFVNVIEEAVRACQDKISMLQQNTQTSNQ